MNQPPDPNVELDPFDNRWALSAVGLLADWNRAGALDAADVHIARRSAALAGESDEQVALAMAVTVAAARDGSVCVDPAELPALPAECVPPAPASWIEAIRRSPLTTDHGLRTSGARPLRWDGDRLYLDRYWTDEVDVADDLLAREALPPPTVDPVALSAAIERFFPRPTTDASQEVSAAVEVTRRAAAAAATRWTMVLGGGPGTGKTTTVAKLLAVLSDLAEQAGHRRLRIALAAPTGKAAARLSEAVEEAMTDFESSVRARLQPLSASTLHRLLKSLPGRRNQFRHHRENRLPHDVVVVDEASMVSLTLMARLLAAVGPQTRLILVGDPHQLASVDAGAVLADIADGLDLRAGGAVEERSRPGSGVVLLQHIWRFDQGIAALAAAVRAGRTTLAGEVLTQGRADVMLLGRQELESVREQVVAAGSAVRQAALDGNADQALAALERHRVLCGHRTGPVGVAAWRQQVELWLAADQGGPEQAVWYPGRPLLVTANDYALGLHNGDTGVVVLDDDGLPVAAFGRGEGARRFRPSRLGQVETVHAMTVHRSQGSQFGHVTLVLPELDSPLLTRELVYTALTRASASVRIVGELDAFLAAVERPAARASGLVRRLQERP